MAIEKNIFDGCYIMQQEDIESFADTLADGFSHYNIFEYVCNGVYDSEKMKLFWGFYLSLFTKNAICIADSEEINSVLIYIRPNTKEPGVLSYLRAGVLKLCFKVGLRLTWRLIHFDAEAQVFAKRYQTANDGYLLAFATRHDKQGQHYGSPLINALVNYLDHSGEGCYLETLKAENIGIYEHFGFTLKEKSTLKMSGFTLFAMHRKAREKSK